MLDFSVCVCAPPNTYWKYKEELVQYRNLLRAPYFDRLTRRLRDFRATEHVTWTCRTLHHTKQCLYVAGFDYTCNDQVHAKISLIVIQELSMSLLIPHVHFHPHSLMIDTPCIWNASSAKWHDTFSQWDLSIRQVSRNMSRMCQIYIGCDTILMSVHQKAIVVEIWKCDAISKNIPFRLRKR